MNERTGERTNEQTNEGVLRGPQEAFDPMSKTGHSFPISITVHKFLGCQKAHAIKHLIHITLRSLAKLVLIFWVNSKVSEVQKLF